ncbi:MAG TPA: GNAT family N-acetyltransferase [Candidatus Elarobacter sp.]|jgi:ribosomal protein S18 acetylase RimI-like enzyme
MIPDRAEAAFWAAYLRNRNVDAGSADDGAVAVAGGYAIYVKGSKHQVAYAVGSTRALREDDLDVLAGFYGRRSSAVRLELRDEAYERDRELLEAAGFVAEAPRLGLYEAALPPPDGTPGIVAHPASDRAGWIRLLVRAAAPDGAPDDALRRSVEVCAAAAHGLFVAEVDGVPAGGGAVAVTGEYAYLFCGAVLPEFRRRGVHRALIAARAAFGAERGAARTALKIADGGAGAVQRAGFERTASLRRLRRDGA